jgi:hypothetical protein
MSKIFVAPADSANDQANLERSIANPVARQLVIQNFSDATYPELIDIERRSRGFYAWGLRNEPGNMEHWFQMGIGDTVLLSYEGAYRHYGKVLGRYENRRAAKAIWGNPDDPDGVCELLCFLTEPIPLSLSHEDLEDYLAGEWNEFQEVPEETITRIETDFESVDRFLRHRLLNTNAGGPVLDMSGIVRLSEREQQRLKAFDADGTTDRRAMIIDSIITRRGRPEFRQKLLDVYEHQCAITGCNADDALEAAYIIPHRGDHTHEPSNGILLRSDLHTLFDLGKIAVDTRTMTIILAEDLTLNSSYRILTNRPLRFPKDESQRPSTEALDLHRTLAGL